MNTYLFRRSKKRFPRKVIAEAHTYTYIHIRYIPYTYASPCIREGVPLSPRIPNAGSLERAEIRQKKNMTTRGFVITVRTSYTTILHRLHSHSHRSMISPLLLQRAVHMITLLHRSKRTSFPVPRQGLSRQMDISNVQQREASQPARQPYKILFSSNPLPGYHER